MRSAWNASDRQELHERLMTLRPQVTAKWGRMSAPQMVAHLADSLRMALGEFPVAPKNAVLRFTPIKQLIIYCLPFPKGAPTAVELVTRAPSSWQGEIADVTSLMEQFGRRERNGPWPDHPAFGRLRGSAWGVLIYRHMDHHLRQFGV